MKQKIAIGFILLLVIGLMMLPGCSKKQVQPDPSAIGTIDPFDLAREGALSAEEEAAKRRAIEEQRLMDEQRLTDEQKRQAMLKDQFVTEDIYFGFDQAVITPEAQEILRKKAAFLRENSGISLVIEGHCDERGTAEYNLALGERRALAAKAFLMNMGISGSRLMTISYGEERPKDPRQTEEAWAKNRRAHFVIR